MAWTLSSPQAGFASPEVPHAAAALTVSRWCPLWVGGRGCPGGWAGVCWEGGWHGKGIPYSSGGVSSKGARPPWNSPGLSDPAHLALLDLMPHSCSHWLTWRGTLPLCSHTIPQVCTRPLFSGSALVARSGAPLLWPVKQNQMPGKDQDGREPAESRDQGILMTGPCPQFPLCIKRRWTGQFLKTHPLGGILA